MITLAQLAAAWHGFFHDPISPASVSAFRVLLGLALLANGLLLLPDLRLFFGPDGVLPLGAVRRAYGASRFNLFYYLPDDLRSVKAVFAAHLLAAALLTAGLFTPAAAALAFVTLASINHRNMALCYGADNILRLMCFLTIFSQAGAMFSVDALLWPGHGGGSPWAQRLMQLQVALVYARTVEAKLRGKTWWRGTASYFPTHVRNYARRPLPMALERPWFFKATTWGTLAIESLIAGGVWLREVRYPLLVAGALFHLGLELTMNVQLFGAVMVSCLVLFVEPTDLLDLLRRAHFLS